ncbi:MAG: two-component system, cell cycle sensor histidine kinase and response regulator CckA, partial [Thermodesulfobacteriota bacterium]|nr:two-component system, cell cycle sensor histidine kinase and response regulator CckA [Thermodesulfobacteriota bacterium]
MHLLVITATVLTGFLTLTMAFYYFSRVTFPGFGKWTIGGGLIASGYVMIALRGVLPTSLAIVIQNFLFPLAAVFYLGGTRSFLGLSDISRKWYLLPLANALFAAGTVCWFDSAAWRTLMVSFAFSVPHLVTSYIIFKDYSKTKSVFSLVLGTEMASASALLFGWAIFSFTVSDFHLLTGTLAHAGFFISLMVLQIVITFSFLMLNAERSNRELLLAQDALRFSQEKYSKAFKGTPDSISISRMSDGKIVEVNEAFSLLTGYSRAEALESSTVALTLWENHQDRDRVVALLRDGKSVRDHEAKFRTKSGQILDCLYSGDTIFLGDEVHVLSVVRDISDRKRAEAERESYRSQLLQSQKMQALGTLAAGIAHDFNNMLQVILGYSDLLLLGKKKGEPGYSELKKIIKTSEDARDLVQKIRVFSRRADIQPIPLDLNKSVREVENFLRQTLPGTIDIETHLTENLATINADPGLMNQMLMNLGINAGEAMRDGGTLTVETGNIQLEKDFCQPHPVLEPGLHVLLMISDTGRGIASEHLDRLFDPFYSTKTRDYHKGTGLGLPVVQGIVELHKGFIDLRSDVGKGTTFKIYLPAMETAQAQKAQEELPAPPRGTETILLVEDEEIVRNLGRDTLEQFGYTVIAVADGQEAVQVYEKEKDSIALVILDIIMPRMDGRQSIEELLKLNP